MLKLKKSTKYSTLTVLAYYFLFFVIFNTAVTLAWFSSQLTNLKGDLSLGELAAIVKIYENTDDSLGQDTYIDGLTNATVVPSSASSVTTYNLIQKPWYSNEYTSIYLEVENTGTIDLKSILRVYYDNSNLLNFLSYYHYQLVDITNDVNVYPLSTPREKLAAYNSDFQETITENVSNYINNVTVNGNNIAASLPTINMGTTKFATSSFYRLDIALSAIPTELLTEFNNLPTEQKEIKINAVITLKQTNAPDDDSSEDSGLSIYVSTSDAFINAVNSASNGDTLYLTTNITISRNVTITHRVNIVLNGFTLTINGNLAYDIGTSGTTRLDVSNNSILNILGNFIIDTPNSTFRILGSGSGAQSIILGNGINPNTGNFYVNALKDDNNTATYGYYQYGVSVMKKEAEGLISYATMRVDSNTRITVGLASKTGLIESVAGASNIEVYNYGEISNINFSSMMQLAETNIQIYIYNGNRFIITNPAITLPSWSLGWKSKELQHISNAINTRIVNAPGSNTVYSLAGSLVFLNIDIENVDIATDSVINLGGNYYRVNIQLDANGQDNNTTQSYLREYFFNNNNGATETELETWYSTIKGLVLYTYNTAVVKVSDFSFMNTYLTGLQHLNLTYSNIANSTIPVSAFYNKASLQDVVFPLDDLTIGAAAFYGTSLNKVTLSSTIVSIGVDAFNVNTAINGPIEIFYEGENATALQTYISSLTPEKTLLFMSPSNLALFKANYSITDTWYINSYAKYDFVDEFLNYYRIIDGNSVEIVYYDGDWNNLNILNTVIYDVYNYRVVGISQSAYRRAINAAGLTYININIPNNILYIRSDVFYNAHINNLKLNNVTNIGAYAFYNANILTSDARPLSFYSMSAVGDYAFSHAKIGTIGTTSLITFELANTTGGVIKNTLDLRGSYTPGVGLFNSASFYGVLVNLENVTRITSNMTNNLSLYGSELHLNNVGEIGDSAFEFKFKSYTELHPYNKVFVSEVKTIGRYAFRGMYLNEFVIGVKTKYTTQASVNNNVSYGGTENGMIYSDFRATNLTIDGMLPQISSGKATFLFGSETIGRIYTNVTIKNTGGLLYGFMFYGNSDMNGITITNLRLHDITIVDEYALHYANITNVYSYSGGTLLQNSAITSVGNYAFRYINSGSFGNLVLTNVGTYAFADAFVPAGNIIVNGTVADYAFYNSNTTGVSAISFTGTVGNYVFSNSNIHTVSSIYLNATMGQYLFENARIYNATSIEFDNMRIAQNSFINAIIYSDAIIRARGVSSVAPLAFYSLTANTSTINLTNALTIDHEALRKINVQTVRLGNTIFYDTLQNTFVYGTSQGGIFTKDDVSNITNLFIDGQLPDQRFSNHVLGANGANIYITNIYITESNTFIPDYMFYSTNVSGRLIVGNIYIETENLTIGEYAFGSISVGNIIYKVASWWNTDFFPQLNADIWAQDSNGKPYLMSPATAANYTVTYDSNKPTTASGNVSGTTVGTSHVYNIAKELTANEYMLAGWMFTGWNTLANGTGTAYFDKQSVVNLTSTNGAVITLYAQWEPITYTIIFEANKPSTTSETVSGTIMSEEHIYDTIKALPMNAYTLTSWVFAGWNTMPNGSGISFVDEQNVSNLTQINGAAVTLYAQWAPITYTVTFNANKPSGASGSIGGTTENSIHTYNAVKTLTSNGYSLTGYLFTGWNTMPNGSGTVYVNEQSVINLSSINGTIITLYANWMPITYTINYNSNKPSSASGNITGATAHSSHIYDEFKNLTANNYSLIGWVFDGWNTLANGNGTNYNNSQNIINLASANGAVVILYAKWTPISYSITYNSNKPSAAIANVSGTTLDSSHNYDTLKTLTSNGYSLTGWTFNGWNTALDNSGAFYTNIENVMNLSSVNGTTITLYAVWSGTAITTAQQFYNFATANNSASTDMYYLANDIDMSTITWNYDVDNNAITFRGTLDGNNKKISNLTINNNSSSYLYLGIFPIMQGGTIYNLTFENAYLVLGSTGLGGTNIRAGLIAGLVNGGTNNISNITIINGGVRATNAAGAGGLIGSVTGGSTVVNIQNIKTTNLKVFNKAANAGGIIGAVNTSGATANIYDIDAQGEVYSYAASSYTGGIIGRVASGVVVDIRRVVIDQTSRNTLETNATYYNLYTQRYLGGMIGYNLSPSANVTIYDTFFTGALYTNANSRGNNIGTVTGYYSSSANIPTVQRVYHANVEFRSTSNGAVIYTPASPTGQMAELLRTDNVDNEMPRVSDWNNFFVNLNATNNYWSQDPVTGRPYLNMGVLEAATTYTITYNGNKPSAASGVVNGTTANSSHIYGVGKPLTTNGYSLTGYLFAGWNTMANGSGIGYADAQSVMNLTSVNGATVTLYAQWTPITYSVIFDENKPSISTSTVSGTTGNSSHTYDVAKALTTNGYSLTSYLFAGWNTMANGSGTNYANAQSVVNLSTTNNAVVTLYARWTPITYTITFNANKPTIASGVVSGVTANSSHTYNMAKTLTANGYTLPGYLFMNWNTMADGSGIDYVDQQSVINLSGTNGATVTLYAEWMPITYTINYDYNKPSTATKQMIGATANSSHTYDEFENLTTNGYSLSGWVFTGWNTLANGNGTAYNDEQSVANLTTVDGSVVTLYAVWTPITYTITYFGNEPEIASGSIGGTTTNSSHDYDQFKALNTNGYVLTGWLFAGWNTMANGSGTAFTDEQEVINLTSINGAIIALYAQWSGTPISTAQQFYDFATKTNSLSTDRYYLTNDIDFTGFTWNYDATNNAVIFRGNLDGNNKTLRNLNINSNDAAYLYLGIFPIMQGGTVNNLTLENVFLVLGSNALGGTNIRAGLIAGEVIGLTNTIHNITVINGGVRATNAAGAGGLVGSVTGASTVLDIYNIKAINLKVFNKAANAGGLVGAVNTSGATVNISNIDTQGEVFSYATSSYTGGVIGRVTTGAIVDIKKAIVEQTSRNTLEGNPTYYNEYSRRYLGGFIGYTASSSSNVTISDAFFTGALFPSETSRRGDVGTVTGYFTATNTRPTLTRVYYANVQFRSSSGIVTYTAPSVTGQMGTLVTISSTSDLTYGEVSFTGRYAFYFATIGNFTNFIYNDPLELETASVIKNIAEYTFQYTTFAQNSDLSLFEYASSIGNYAFDHATFVANSDGQNVSFDFTRVPTIGHSIFNSIYSPLGTIKLGNNSYYNAHLSTYYYGNPLGDEGIFGSGGTIVVEEIIIVGNLPDAHVTGVYQTRALGLSGTNNVTLQLLTIGEEVTILPDFGFSGYNMLYRNKITTLNIYSNNLIVGNSTFAYTDITYMNIFGSSIVLGTKSFENSLLRNMIYDRTQGVGEITFSDSAERTFQYSTIYVMTGFTQAETGVFEKIGAYAFYGATFAMDADITFINYVEEIKNNAFMYATFTKTSTNDYVNIDLSKVIKLGEEIFAFIPVHIGTLTLGNSSYATLYGDNYSYGNGINGVLYAAGRIDVLNIVGNLPNINSYNALGNNYEDVLWSVNYGIINIASGVTTLPANVFISTSSATPVTIQTLNINSNTLTIGANAFYDAHINAVNVNVTTITLGTGAFHSTSITTLTLNGATINLGNSAFNNSQITNMIYSGTNSGAIHMTGPSTFANATISVMTNFTYTISTVNYSIIKNISNYAFENAIFAQNLNVSWIQYVNSIGNYAFSGATFTKTSSNNFVNLNLTRVLTIGTNAFYRLQVGLGIVTLGNNSYVGNASFAYGNGVEGIFNNSGTIQHLIIAGALPTTANALGNKSSNVTYLTTYLVVEISSGVTTLPANLFAGADTVYSTNIGSLYIYPTNITIGQGFLYNTVVTNLYIPNITTFNGVGANAFRNSSITNINIPSTLTLTGIIDDYAFYSFNFTTVTLNVQNVSYIGEYAFAYIIYNDSLLFNLPIALIDADYAFSFANISGNLTFNSISSFGSNMFNGLISGNAVTYSFNFVDALEVTSDYAFGNMNGGGTVYVAITGLPTLNSYRTFYNSTNIVTLVFDDALINLNGNNVFEMADNLISVAFSNIDYVTTVNETIVTIPDDVKVYVPGNLLSGYLTDQYWSLILSQISTTYNIDSSNTWGFYIVGSANNVSLVKYLGSNTSLTIPTTITYNSTNYIVISTGPDIFTGTAVTTIVIPRAIQSVDLEMFSNSNVSEVSFTGTGEDPFYISTEGSSRLIYESSDRKILYKYLSSNTATSHTISTTVMEIASKAFYKNNYLQSITFVAGTIQTSSWLYSTDYTTYLTLAEYAISEMPALTSVHLQNNSTGLGIVLNSYSISSNPSLTNLTIIAFNFTISSYSVYNNTSLALTRLERCTTYGTGSLFGVTLYSSISIEPYAFVNSGKSSGSVAALRIVINHLRISSNAFAYSRVRLFELNFAAGTSNHTATVYHPSAFAVGISVDVNGNGDIVQNYLSILIRVPSANLAYFQNRSGFSYYSSSIVGVASGGFTGIWNG